MKWLWGEYVAVKSDKYDERPLLGRVTASYKNNFQMDWMVGSYSGTWREWKSRSDRKTVIFNDFINYTNVIMRSVKITASKRLRTDIVQELTRLYSLCV